MLKKSPSNRRLGMTLTELLGVVTILGALAAMVLPRSMSHVGETNRQACFANQGDIELQVQLWKRNQGSFPAANLSDIGANLTYFPSGLKTCPVDGTSYTIDTTTGQVVGHTH